MTKIKDLNVLPEKFMEVWLVGVNNYESNYTVCICATKDLAEKKLFKKRDELVKEWKKFDKHTQKGIEEHCKKENKPVWIDDTYTMMIANVSGNDYKKWNNYPYDYPYICKMEVKET